MKGKKTGGRKIGSRNRVPSEIKARARELTDVALTALEQVARDEKHPQRVAAANALLDRGWGKPAQAVTGPDGVSPLAVTIIHEHRD